MHPLRLPPRQLGHSISSCGGSEEPSPLRVDGDDNAAPTTAYRTATAANHTSHPCMPNAISLPMRLAALLALLPSLAIAQKAPATDQWTSVRDTIRAVMARTDVASVSVAVSRKGVIVWEESFGWQIGRRWSVRRRTPCTRGVHLEADHGDGPHDPRRAEESRPGSPANDYLGTGKLTEPGGDASKGNGAARHEPHRGLPLHYQFYYENQPYPSFRTTKRLRATRCS